MKNYTEDAPRLLSWFVSGSCQLEHILLVIYTNWHCLLNILAMLPYIHKVKFPRSGFPKGVQFSISPVSFQHIKPRLFSVEVACIMYYVGEFCILSKTDTASLMLKAVLPVALMEEHCSFPKLPVRLC